MLRYIQQAWLVLTLGLAFGVALAGMNSYLAPKIAANEATMSQAAAVELVEGGVRAELATVDGQDVYKVYSPTGTLAGWAFIAQGQGYADQIRLIVGVSADAKTLMGYKVLYSQETPGLGDKISTDGFREQFSGKELAADAADLEPSKAAGQLPSNQIQAITGATISSRAVCNIINHRIDEIQPALNAAAMGGIPNAR